MAEQPGTARSWTPGAIRELAMSFQSSRILLTAVELRLFSLIGKGGLTSAEVAGRAACHPRATDRLLNALCAMQLLLKRDGRFWNTADSRKYLDDGSPDYAAGLGHTASMWHSWSGLTDAVREGRPSLRGAINDRGDAWLKPFIANWDEVARLILLRVRRDVAGNAPARWARCSSCPCCRCRSRRAPPAQQRSRRTAPGEVAAKP